jgi:hypothetical protein
MDILRSSELRGQFASEARVPRCLEQTLAIVTTFLARPVRYAILVLATLSYSGSLVRLYRIEWIFAGMVVVGLASAGAAIWI